MALTAFQQANFRHHTHSSEQVIDPDTGDPIVAGGSTSFGTPAIVLGTAAAAGAASTAVRTDATLLAFDATTPSTQAFGDAGTVGVATVAARRDHKHVMPALGTTAAAIGTSAGGSAVTPSKSDHVHATGAGTPSTQAFADSATTGSGPAASMTDHKHAMPTLGYGLTGNSAPAIGLTTATSYATATTSLSTAAYADITGVSVTLAAGTWLIFGTVVGSSVNALAILNVALTHSDNTIITEGSGSMPASGSASVAMNASVTVVGVVTPGGSTTYKLRGARGNTTITGTVTAMDGAGTATTNNLTDNSDKGTGMWAIRVA